MEEQTMGINGISEIINALNDEQKEEWKSRLLKSFSNAETFNKTAPFSGYLALVYGYSRKIFDCNKKIICYGVGKVAEKNIGRLKDSFQIAEFWDAYSEKTVFCDIPVKRPHSGEANAIIVVCINKKEIRNKVYESMTEMGYQDVFSWEDFLWLCDQRRGMHEMEANITEESEGIFRELMDSFKIIEDPAIPVLYSVIPTLLSEVKLDLLDMSDISGETIKRELLNALATNRECLDAIDRFLSISIDNSLVFCEQIELLMRNILKNGVKTKYRLMRMAGDYPYDGFAALELLWVLLEQIFKDDMEAQKKSVKALRTVTKSSMIINGVYCRLLCKNSYYDKALEIASNDVHVFPNELLSNETFYQVARICIDNGISVRENLPEYDLGERFCWSGVSFAWCGGFDIANDRADLGPCFRPLQCAARPEGEFWTSGDWKEFRRSVTDGSFRYCQKNQCPNIVAGWLPKKSEFMDTELRGLFEGNYDVIPKLEELHLSYDGHCNLKCPSCRLEMQTNTKDKNDELDRYYDRYLKKYVKNAKHLCLSGCGEALISPHSRKLLQSLSREEYPELEVELRTNMTVMNPMTWASLGKGRHVIKHIAASIDASKKETFERLRYPAKWDIVYENLKFVRSLRDNNEIDMFEFHVVVQKDNIHELFDIVKLAIDMHADAVTFSKIVNWRNMPQQEYDDKNPFWVDNPEYDALMKEMDKIEKLRRSIERGDCDWIKDRKKMYINIHFRPDPNETYDEIRTGRIRIR